MSSAILYLAIVAIWACVLIPRWLRRDSARGGSAPVTAEPAGQIEPDAGAEDGPQADLDADVTAEDEPRRLPPPPVRAAEPLSADESRRRMLGARRRLLLMLIGLEIAAIALAGLGLAAVWVVVPPTIMLGGYLLLLREAGQADAERAQYEAQVITRARAREAQTQRVTPVEGTPTTGIAEAVAVLAAKFAAAPVPADYEDSAPGRDFAPGLAGKYTTSNADSETADDDYDDPYEADPYEAPPLRAVGD